MDGARPELVVITTKLPEGVDWVRHETADRVVLLVRDLR